MWICNVEYCCDNKTIYGINDFSKIHGFKRGILMKLFNFSNPIEYEDLIPAKFNRWGNV
jgi:hypothetical protein